MGLIEQYDYKLDSIPKFGDGDSFWAVLSKDMGFYITSQALVHIRVAHVDTPERGELNYREAASFTAQWLIQHGPNLRVRSEERDEFGRWISVVYDDVTREQLSAAIKAAGLAKPVSRWNTDEQPI